MATLNIMRDSGYADRLRAYKIIVDGKQVGEIRDGQTAHLPISSGQHQLSLRIDWCGSKPIQFTVVDSDSVTFRVKSNLRGPKMVVALWYMLFQRDSYLVIEAEFRQ